MNGIQDCQKFESAQIVNQPTGIGKRKRAHNFIDLSGQQFGRLLIISFAGTNDKNKRAMWLCRCACKKEITTNGIDLRSGHTQSCGCFKKDRTSETHKKHGLARTPFYEVWTQIKKRCFSPKDKSFKYYGGRGIKLCNKWLCFESFKNDMYENYLKHKKNNKTTTIERINNNKNYSHENCRWATMGEQSRNTRRTKMITYNGKTLCILDWAKELGVVYITLYNRLKKHSPEIAFNM